MWAKPNECVYLIHVLYKSAHAQVYHKHILGEECFLHSASKLLSFYRKLIVISYTLCTRRPSVLALSSSPSQQNLLYAAYYTHLEQSVGSFMMCGIEYTSLRGSAKILSIPCSQSAASITHSPFTSQASFGKWSKALQRVTYHSEIKDVHAGL